MNKYFNLAHLQRVMVICFSFMLTACSSFQQVQEPLLMPNISLVPNLPNNETTSQLNKLKSISEELVVAEVVTAPYESGRSGKVGGVSIKGVNVWQLPDAPSGSSPDQSWLAIGSDAQGDIYISGHDHHSNSMLYRLFQYDQTLRWVGDARTASQAANNWLPGETAEKFHTRPIDHGGRVYVATLDKSGMDTGFQSTRGFHWYGYDKNDNQLLDLSASEPNGVAVEQLQIVTIQKDPQRNLLYGMSVPENKLVVYDIKKGRTTVLGNPQQWKGYFYSNRFMWVDSRGRVYISGGSERQQWNRGEEVQRFDHVWYYDPTTGFGELNDFSLQGANAIEVGQWDRKHENLYVSDDQGNIYRFSDSKASWTFLGRPSFSSAAKTWVFQLSADEKKIYIGLSDMGASRNAIYEYDIDTGTSFELANIRQLDKQAAKKSFIAGYDSWDRNGNFYIAAFSMYDGDNVLMLAINPVEIKVSHSILPELVEVAVAQVDDKFVVRRTGEAKQSLTVLYQLKGVDRNGHVIGSKYGKLNLPTGQSELIIERDSLLSTTQQLSADGPIECFFELEADGNTYILGGNKQISI